MVEEISKAIIDGDTDEAIEQTQKALAANMGAVAIVNEALVPAMDTVAKLWKDGDYFMSDVILSADAFGKAMDIIAPALAASGTVSNGKFLLGVVEGDLHDLGKNIVVAMLRANGFEVIDLGVDVPVQKFVQAVKENKPNILGIGAYMSTTIPQLKDVIDALKAEGLRDGMQISIGGVCCNDTVAERCGADKWGRDAMYTVELAKKYMGVSK
ncbi:MAG: corrinoid protein [Treponema sp.]|jgi:methanogenic corrinoid protein MtbC1|nr:corrinoid protein [Treponema sp.]